MEGPFMNVRIGDDFVIKSDANQFVLYRVQKAGKDAKEPGKETLGFVGYYSSIEHLVQALPNKALMKSDATSLHDAIREVQDIGKQIRKAIQI
jgi:hypothetical protein